MAQVKIKKQRPYNTFVARAFQFLARIDKGADAARRLYQTRL